MSDEDPLGPYPDWYYEIPEHLRHYFVADRDPRLCPEGTRFFAEEPPDDWHFDHCLAEDGEDLNDCSGCPAWGIECFAVYLQ